ncbi:hypothetical protein MRX96_012732 [Rhipicephalus microplus]
MQRSSFSSLTWCAEEVAAASLLLPFWTTSACNVADDTGRKSRSSGRKTRGQTTPPLGGTTAKQYLAVTFIAAWHGITPAAGIAQDTGKETLVAKLKSARPASCNTIAAAQSKPKKISDDAPAPPGSGVPRAIQVRLLPRAATIASRNTAERR